MAQGGYAVIGSGIAGASVAYHLSNKTKAPITVYDMGGVGQATTSKSMGYFGMEGTETTHRMKQYGMALYNEFLSDPKTSARYTQTGRLILASSEEEADQIATDFSPEQEEPVHFRDLSGTVNQSFLTASELKQRVLVPELATDNIGGAVYQPDLGYIDPPGALAEEFARRAMDNGVKFETGVEVTDIVITDGRVERLETDSGPINVREVICSAGPWNIQLSRMAGIDLPVKHTMAPIMTLEPDPVRRGNCPALSHRESGIYLRRNRDGTVHVGSSPGGYHDAGTEYDPSEVADSMPQGIRSRAREAIEDILPYLRGAPVVDEWAGVRTKTPDSNPIVGRTAVDGFSVVSFNADGIQLAPIAGKIVTEQLVDDNPTSYYEIVSISRFDGYADNNQY